MAEVAPWLQPQQPQSEKAPWITTEPEISTVEDVAKTVPAALARGAISVAGTPGDLQEIVKLADSKGYNPFGWLGEKLGETKLGQFLKAESEKTAKGPIAQGVSASGDTMGAGNIELPSSAKIKKAVEENVTGPLYEPKTAIGRGVNTGLEVAPSLAMGPVGGVRGLVAKSAGAGAASELAGQGAAAIKDKLPESVQPWAEPAARAVGTVAGMFTPAGVRKAVTPLPMADEQFAAVQRLRQANPELVNASTAGQLTERPRLMSMEARSPMGKNAEAAQGEAFTTGAMRQGGITGDFTALPQGRAVGDAIGNIRRGNAIPSTEFQPMMQDAVRIQRDLQRSAGRGRTPELDDVIQQLRFGAMNNGQPVLSMPGHRYDFMRGALERAANATNIPGETRAIGQIRDRMDEAFRRGLPPDVAADLVNRERQYANYNVLREIPPLPGKTTVTPQEVKSAVGHKWGNAAANEGRGTLAPLADDASRVMTKHPEPSDKMPPWAHALATVATSVATGAGNAAHSGLPGALGGGTMGALVGHQIAPTLYNTVANAGSRVVGSRPVQSYLANQAWRPGAATTTDMDQLVRLLMSPEARPAQ